MATKFAFVRGGNIVCLRLAYTYTLSYLSLQAALRIPFSLSKANSLAEAGITQAELWGI